MKPSFFAGMFSCLSLLLISGSVLAASTGIQMLPPMQSNDASKPCKGSEGSKLLSWDGATSIKCNQNAKITATGLFVGSATSGGYLQLGATDAVNEGAQLFMRGAGDYDTWYPDVNQNNLRFFTQSSHANQVQIFNSGAGAAGLYVEGNVGIGDSTPTSNLSILSTNSITSETNYADAVGGLFIGSGKSGLLFDNNQIEITNLNSALYVNYNAAANTIINMGGGKVGIGTDSPDAKLDVAGGVKVANDVGACTAAKAGTIRWTGASFQGCNGVAWVGLGGTPKVDYPTCIDAIHNTGTGLVTYYTQWGATGGHNINIACPKDYVVVATDDNTMSDAYCCKMKLE